MLIVASMVVGSLVLPVLPRRPFFRPKSTGEFDVAFVVAGGALVGSYSLYEVVWRPWRYGPLGYRLAGEFVVQEKNYLFSKCWVRLAPGYNFQLG